MLCSRISRFLLSIIFIINGSACGPQDQNSHLKKQQFLTVEAKLLSSPLFYSGIIQPLQTVVVSSPTEGNIQEMLFHYGDFVQKGKLLFTLSSEKFRSDYKTAFMQYIKAKSEFDTSQGQLFQSQFLLKNGLISKDELNAKERSFYTAKLALFQAKDALNFLMKQEPKQVLKIDQFNIEDIDELAKVLQAQGDSQILHITSPAEGIVLLPNKSDNEGEVKKIDKGDQIKKEQTLALIGDTSGFMVRVNVSEFTINQLHIGQKVKITGAAFPEFTLQGKISSIERQAQSNSNNMPVFPIEIVVSSLTQKERETIHIGMSAKVEIDVESDAKMTVPISAVFEKNGNTFVKVRDVKTKKVKEVLVKTGQTTLDSVIIDAGLKAGDTIVYAG